MWLTWCNNRDLTMPRFISSNLSAFTTERYVSMRESTAIALPSSLLGKSYPLCSCGAAVGDAASIHFRASRKSLDFSQYRLSCQRHQMLISWGCRVTLLVWLCLHKHIHFVALLLLLLVSILFILYISLVYLHPFYSYKERHYGS